jgi:Spx/MgsR family transcriptional regulator
MITVYGIRNCDTIKKTLKWLEAEGLEYQLHDYRKDGLSDSLVNQLLNQFSLEQLINRRGTTWRNLPESSKQGLSPATAENLMQKYPALIKRPILCDGKQWLIGFDPLSMAEQLTR